MLNLKHLYYFHVFTQELSTSKAAKRLGITAPALSNQLKHLEGYLGQPLTKRAGGKVVVTELGEMVSHYADRMFSAYLDLEIGLSANSDIVKDRCLRVGICQNFGYQFSFDLLSLIVESNLTFSKKVQITFETSDSLLRGLKKDEFDLILGAFKPETATESNWVSQSLVFPVRLFAPLSLMEGAKGQDIRLPMNNLSEIIELANKKRISLALPMHPSLLRSETDRFLMNSKVLPARTVECNSAGAIVQLIERGFAMGFVPIPCLLDFKSAASLTVLGPPGGYWIHGTSIFFQKGEGRSMAKASVLADMFSPH